eukprot:6242192-Amphidinium_carterae.1
MADAFAKQMLHCGQQERPQIALAAQWEARVHATPSLHQGGQLARRKLIDTPDFPDLWNPTPPCGDPPSPHAGIPPWLQHLEELYRPAVHFTPDAPPRPDATDQRC